LFHKKNLFFSVLFFFSLHHTTPLLSICFSLHGCKPSVDLRWLWIDVKGVGDLVENMFGRTSV
jgi:hypothetical protein